MLGGRFYSLSEHASNLFNENTVIFVAWAVLVVTSWNERDMLLRFI